MRTCKRCGCYLPIGADSCVACGYTDIPINNYTSEQALYIDYLMGKPSYDHVLIARQIADLQDCIVKTQMDIANSKQSAFILNSLHNFIKY